MTLDIVFMQNNKPVVRINMTCSSLYGKIFDNLTNEEFSQNLWDFDAFEDKTVTDKTFIKKIHQSLKQVNRLLTLGLYITNIVPV